MEEKTSLKVKVQKLGTSLSNMVMPNIGAFIAWGVLPLFFTYTKLFYCNSFSQITRFINIQSTMERCKVGD